MKLTSRTPVIWQPDEMTCYGVQPKNVNAARARDDFLAVLFSLLTGCTSYKNTAWEYIRLQRIFVRQVRHQQEGAKSNIAYLIYTTFLMTVRTFSDGKFSINL